MLFYQFLNCFHLLIHWQHSIYPMNFKPTTLHTTKPCHLPLSKLMNCYLKPSEHIIITGLSYYIFRDIIIFQTRIDSMFSRNTGSKQLLYFIDHTVIQAFPQTIGNLSSALVPINVHTYYNRVNSRKITHWNRVL